MDSRSPLLLLILSGCAVLSGPAEPVPLDWSVEARHGTLDLPPVQIEVTGSDIHFSSGFGTPSPCYRLAASATRDGGTLRLRVVASRATEACFAIVGGYHYTAIARATPSGTHRAVVEHVGPDGAVVRVADVPLTVQ